MNILSVIQRVCASPGIGLDVPTSVFGSTNREHIELAELAQEMAERIHRAHYWQLFRRIATVTGDNVTEAFDLPSDYESMLKKSQIWSEELETPFTHIVDIDTWLGLEVQTFDFVINAWTIFGGQLHIKPALGSGVKAMYFYRANQFVKDQSGALKKEFTTNEDEFRLDNRLLRLGIIWQWKASKGYPYAEDMANYEDALAKAIVDDKGSTQLRLGIPRLSKDIENIAYPRMIEVN